jgi:hypothetical protein
MSFCSFMEYLDVDRYMLLVWLITEFDNGRQTSIEWEELAPVVARYFEAR